VHGYIFHVSLGTVLLSRAGVAQSAQRLATGWKTEDRSSSPGRVKNFHFRAGRTRVGVRVPVGSRIFILGLEDLGVGVRVPVGSRIFIFGLEDRGSEFESR
jgi:hypothetical protein